MTRAAIPHPLPARYFWLADVETGRPLAVFSADHCTRELEAIALEKELRARHHADDPESGIVLRDSLLSPIAPNQLRR